MTITLLKKYNNYQEYINHQKEKTTDLIKRKKWLTQEWEFKINIFRSIFQKLLINNIIDIPNKCLCLGARTGQEVVALINSGFIDTIGIDLVPHSPYVLQDDIHNLSFCDNNFDFIFSNIFDHSLYPNKFISEIERVLKPNGIVLLHLEINTNHDNYCENIISKSNDVIKLFNSCKLIYNKEMPCVLAMNWEICLQKI